ncbi:MAG: ParB N-terminal domain-containing protein [Alphaproteobacteria bacterium]|nr:ParB N-terminal domain-containing protein [Alphaproteobacteria bacterium]
MTSQFPDPAKNLNRALAVHSRARGRARKQAVIADSTAAVKLRNDILPTLTVVMRPLFELKLAKQRLRKAEEAHVVEVVHSIQALGICRPILVDRHGEIIDGQIVFLAAQRLGLDRIPTITIDHLDDAEVRVLRIALNRLAEKGSWDMDALKAEVEELITIDTDIEVTGLTGEEIDLLILDRSNDPSADDGVIEPDLAAPAVTQLGDCWLLGEHRLLCADAREAANYTRLFGDGPVARVVITDPPYGCKIAGLVSGNGAVKHQDFIDGSGGMASEELEALLSVAHDNAVRHLAEGGLVFSFMDYREIETLLRVDRKLGFTLLNILVWDKGRGGMGGLYRNACEFICLFKSGKAPHLDRVKLGKHGRDRTTVLSYPGATTPGSSAREQLHAHPTPKSVEMVADIMIDTTNRGEVILDPFMGSGTAVIAAQRTGRVAYGLELDARYCDVIVRRFEKSAGIEAVHAGSGMTFAQVVAERGALGATRAATTTPVTVVPDDVAVSVTAPSATSLPNE